MSQEGERQTMRGREREKGKRERGGNADHNEHTRQETRRNTTNSMSLCPSVVRLSVSKRANGNFRNVRTGNNE